MTEKTNKCLHCSDNNAELCYSGTFEWYICKKCNTLSSYKYNVKDGSK